VTVGVLPGPSAALCALVVSGLPADRWCFEGFLPRAGKQRKARLSALATEPRTSVLYEAPHRLAATLGALAEACGPDRRVVVAREMTKLHEEVWRGTLGEAVTRAQGRPAEGRPAEGGPAQGGPAQGGPARGAPPRGEHTLVLAGAPEPLGGAGAMTEDEVEAALEMLVGSSLDSGRPVSEAAALAGAELGVPRRRAYAAALRVRAGRAQGAGVGTAGEDRGANYSKGGAEDR
ncbi:MAG: 16S rRNA (cytidine(1402)-2'-O)-methyltransferase, partial [Acidimicrobiales bacterium]